MTHRFTVRLHLIENLFVYHNNVEFISMMRRNWQHQPSHKKLSSIHHLKILFSAQFEITLSNLMNRREDVEIIISRVRIV